MVSGRDKGSWVWVDVSVVLALHDEHLAEHGGLAGLKDRAALEAALSRAVNKATYGTPDAAALAAAYAYGISRNHPFADGNKRTSLVTAELFLALNGFALNATNAECVATFYDLAAGKIGEDALAGWIRERLVAAETGDG